MNQCIGPVLLLLLQQCLCNFNDLRHSAPKNGSLPDQGDILRHLAKIKQEILRHLGITDPPRYRQTTPTNKSKTNHDTDNRINQYKLTDVASYHSEPSDNFTDENIVQFRLLTREHGKQIEVNNVNLLVRIKLRKSRTDNKTQRKLDSKRKRKRKRKKNIREISLLVSNITTDGKPDTLITSVKSKLRKTKSIKLSLPREIIQNALDSSQGTLQFFIHCNGCNKKTRMILVHKKRRRRLMTKTRENQKPKLHKRRPILFVYSHISNGS